MRFCIALAGFGAFAYLFTHANITVEYPGFWNVFAGAGGVLGMILAGIEDIKSIKKH